MQLFAFTLDHLRRVNSPKLMTDGSIMSVATGATVWGFIDIGAGGFTDVLGCVDVPRSQFIRLESAFKILGKNRKKDPLEPFETPEFAVLPPDDGLCGV